MSTGDLISPRLRVFAAIVLLGFLTWVVRLVRAQRLTLRDSLVWLLSTIAALVAAVVPQVMMVTAHLLQIELPSNALFALTALYLVLNLFSVTVAISFVASRTRRLTQECALLRAEIELLRARTAGDAATRGDR